MPSFQAQWKKIKAGYETATNKKKPTDTFLGVFKSKTGLDSGFKAMDEALKSSDIQDGQKAFAVLEKSAIAYRQVLVKAAVAEPNKDLKKEVNKMMDELEDLIDASKMELRAAGKVPSVGSLRDFSALMRTPAFDRVEAFAKSKYRAETMDFLIAMTKKNYSVQTYRTFIKDNDINISAKLAGAFKEDDLANAPWDLATTEALVLFQSNVIRAMNAQTVV